ncbi:MAG: hypothetical protein D6680_15240 [Cyanobacteria bacterium J007]|nr:MAG: hypothetical protein D6680_15240 [Cyanobacteria bacterium J007]
MVEFSLQLYLKIWLGGSIPSIADFNYSHRDPSGKSLFLIKNYQNSIEKDCIFQQKRTILEHL